MSAVRVSPLLSAMETEEDVTWWIHCAFVVTFELSLRE